MAFQLFLCNRVIETTFDFESANTALAKVLFVYLEKYSFSSIVFLRVASYLPDFMSAQIDVQIVAIFECYIPGIKSYYY